ncbi:DUF885 domain-containing protein [Psychroserpens ponticola]|uniref:DUF885 domain-containing protein n=1 Tax=Psychroserpens ponticola TaxID=2932268 RepID=A0ABY7RX02_9FLAO|nr:DUF885 domain-containing protein [Psychroserpens ponticola]WCO00766.1 DUF885 domain-containing protein [Psychroserpens ponticola]
MKKIITLIVIAICFSACKKDKETIENTQTVNKTPKNDTFDLVLSNYYETSLKQNPLNATSAGDSRFNDRLPNFLSDDYAKQIKAFYQKYKTKMNSFSDNELSPSQQLSKEILNWECDIILQGLSFNEDLMPINQMWTLQLTIGQLASGSSSQPFNTIEDYKNWLKRIDGYLLWMNSAEEKMKEGIDRGYVLPESLIVKVLPQLKALTTANMDEHLFYNPIKNFPERFPEKDKAKLAELYESKIKNEIAPAYKKLYDFMSTTYLKHGRTTSGVSDLPNGLEYYSHQIKKYTTTSMTADEIHQLGLKEVARILSEMEAVKKQVGFEGDIIAFFDFVRTNKELMPYDNPKSVIDNFNEIHNTMKPQIEKLFDLKPRTAFEVRRTEAFREASASAEYNPGALDGSRPGIFYTPIPDAKTYNVFADEALFLHEAIPGHHFQISLQQENKDLPDFRKTLWYSSYGEGWALYCESLGKELGLYTDPYQYFGMLSMEMHRAIRLVVDTGIHTKGWSREKAIKYSLENEAESEASIISEIERYMANPGQALSYKIGQLKILELRAKAEKELGDKFDIAQFHNQVLESGCIPLALLETKIDNWIASIN